MIVAILRVGSGADGVVQQRAEVVVLGATHAGKVVPLTVPKLASSGPIRSASARSMLVSARSMLVSARSTVVSARSTDQAQSRDLDPT
jgi:hypothetical protein